MSKKEKPVKVVEEPKTPEQQLEEISAAIDNAEKGTKSVFKGDYSIAHSVRNLVRNLIHLYEANANLIERNNKMYEQSEKAAQKSQDQYSKIQELEASKRNIKQENEMLRHVIASQSKMMACLASGNTDGEHDSAFDDWEMARRQWLRMHGYCR